MGCSPRSGSARAPRSRPTSACAQLLTEAAAVANGTARAIAFKTRDPEAYRYPDRRWKTAFIGNDYRWLMRRRRGRTQPRRPHAVLLPRDREHPGHGAADARRRIPVRLRRTRQHAASTSTAANRYQLTVPPDVPAKDFWSIVAYDPQTRSELQTGQAFPSRNNTRDPLAANADGSITLTFGPTAPDDNPGNWIQTVPGKKWFTILRLYGPLEPWFDKTWIPGDIEPLDTD